MKNELVINNLLFNKGPKIQDEFLGEPSWETIISKMKIGEYVTLLRPFFFKFESQNMKKN